MAALPSQRLQKAMTAGPSVGAPSDGAVPPRKHARQPSEDQPSMLAAPSQVPSQRPVRSPRAERSHAGSISSKRAGLASPESIPQSQIVKSFDIYLTVDKLLFVPRAEDGLHGLRVLQITRGGRDGGAVSVVADHPELTPRDPSFFAIAHCFLGVYLLMTGLHAVVANQIEERALLFGDHRVHCVSTVMMIPLSGLAYEDWLLRQSSSSLSRASFSFSRTAPARGAGAAAGDLTTDDVRRALLGEAEPPAAAGVAAPNAKAVADATKKMFESKFFMFSYTYDLTQTLQRQIEMDRLGGDVSWLTANPDFWWNESATAWRTDIPGGMNEWVVPIIYGFVGSQQTATDLDLACGPSRLTLSLISRRSVHQAGTRFHRRGINESGDVANFVETEQLVWVPAAGAMFSFLQIRGSIPVYWTQGEATEGIKAQPEAHLRGTVAEHTAALVRHYSKLTSTYRGSIATYNLVRHSKHEAIIGGTYDAILEAVSRSRRSAPGEGEILPPVSIDFHGLMHKGSLEKVRTVLQPHIDADLNAMGFFAATLGDGGSITVTARQAGVQRTNCIDCLDRTNVVQCLIAKYVLRLQLGPLLVGSSAVEVVSGAAEFIAGGLAAAAAVAAAASDAPIAEASSTDGSEAEYLSDPGMSRDRAQSTSMLSPPTRRFRSQTTAGGLSPSLSGANTPECEVDSALAKLTELHTTLWVENAHAIAYQYTGAGAQKTGILRSNAQSTLGAMMDMLNALNRLKQRVMHDDARQMAIDLMLQEPRERSRSQSEERTPSGPMAGVGSEAESPHVRISVAAAMAYLALRSKLTTFIEAFDVTLFDRPEAGVLIVAKPACYLVAVDEAARRIVLERALPVVELTEALVDWVPLEVALGEVLEASARSGGGSVIPLSLPYNEVFILRLYTGKGRQRTPAVLLTAPVAMLDDAVENSLAYAYLRVLAAALSRLEVPYADPLGGPASSILRKEQKNRDKARAKAAKEMAKAKTPKK